MGASPRVIAFPTALTGWLLCLCLAGGCGIRSAPLQTISQDGHGAYSLTRGAFRAVIEPAKRRIMCVEAAGGSNLLYVNQDARTGKPGEHVAWGGEKAWLWPQDRWREGKSNWPPPMDVEGLSFSVDRVDASGGLICTYQSDEIGGAIRRQYTIDDKESLVVRSDLLSAAQSGNSSAQGWGLWTIAQVKRPAKLWARIVPGAPATPTPLPPFGPERALSVMSVGHDIVEVGTRGDAPRKVGLEADRFVAWYADGTALRVDQVPLPPESPAYRPGERAQVYSNPATSADPSYIELEFTAPLTPPGRSPLPLTVIYSIHRAQTPEEAMRLLSR